LIRRVYAGVRDAVEQCRFAGVGVADERHRKNVRTRSRTALHCTLRLHARELFLEQLYALAEQSPVGLELRLAGTAQADTAFLAFQVGPPANEPRGKMLELSELDLHLTFVAAGALRKDIEDQAGAIDDAAVEMLFEIALLHR
jgi:hypothetical protein